MTDVALYYQQHLTDSDRQLLRRAAGPTTPIFSALESVTTEEAVFGGDAGAMTVGISPFLAFAVAVHRTAAGLQDTTFVEERWAPRLRIPVFDVAELRELLSDQLRRYFLVELLASYTRVASGVTWTRTGRGWRRRRYSELDMSRLAEMLEVVDASERPGVYRRLGDLALFMLGVFPDNRSVLERGVLTDRLERLSGLASGVGSELGHQVFLELLGARWYRAAVDSARHTGQPLTATLVVAEHMSDHFREARRVLNAVTDRYLFPWREQYFGAA